MREARLTNLLRPPTPIPGSPRGQRRPAHLQHRQCGGPPARPLDGGRPCRHRQPVSGGCSVSDVAPPPCPGKSPSACPGLTLLSPGLRKRAAQCSVPCLRRPVASLGTKLDRPLGGGFAAQNYLVCTRNQCNRSPSSPTHARAPPCRDPFPAAAAAAAPAQVRFGGRSSFWQRLGESPPTEQWRRCASHPGHPGF